MTPIGNPKDVHKLNKRKKGAFINGAEKYKKWFPRKLWRKTRRHEDYISDALVKHLILRKAQLNSKDSVHLENSRNNGCTGREIIEGYGLARSTSPLKARR